VAVSVNKIRVNSLYMGASRGHLCDSKAFLLTVTLQVLYNKLNEINQLSC